MGPDDWREARVADLVADGSLAINDGYRVRNTELGSVGTPFVRGGDIGDGWILTDVADRIRPEFQDRVVGKLTKEGDIAFITKGTVGRVGYLRAGQPSVVFAPQVCYWRVLDAAVLDQRFLYFLMNGPEFKANLDAVKTHGSMVADYVSLSDQRLFRLRLPRIETQRGIGCTLGSLDDKIELNRRTNETLEAMARTLFRSWFVDFDPVRAKADGEKPQGMDAATAKLFPDSFEQSPLGSIPKGWRVGNLGEVAANPRRGVAPNDVQPETPYIGLEHMPRRSICLGEWGCPEELARGKFRFDLGNILFGKLRPYFHKVGIAPVDGICSTDILVVTPKQRAWFGFVLGHISSDELVAHTDAASNGTKMPRTNWSDIARYTVAVPPVELADVLTKQIDPLVQLIRENILQSRTLAATRDALLQKLLSGEVRVREVA
ncbi:MAG: restriction endonuclease subunit S [Gemmataceae bacterium]